MKKLWVLGLLLVFFSMSFVSAAASHTVDRSVILDDFLDGAINQSVWSLTNTSATPGAGSSITEIDDGGPNMIFDIIASNSNDPEAIADRSEAPDFNSNLAAIWFNISVLDPGAGTAKVSLQDAGGGVVDLITIPDSKTLPLTGYRIDIFSGTNTAEVRANTTIFGEGDLVGNISISGLNDAQNWSLMFKIDSTGSNGITMKVYKVNYNVETQTALISPEHGSILLESPSTFTVISTAIGLPGSPNVTNVSLGVWSSNGTIFNNTEINTITGSSNQSSFQVEGLRVGDYIWNAYSCATNGTDTACGWANENNTFTWGLGDISSSYTSTIYETATAKYNITFNVSAGTPTVDLYFNGTKKTSIGTKLHGDQWRFDNTLQTETITGIKSLIWEITSENIKRNESAQQTVSLLNISLCGNPHTVPFLNFTYKNETTDAEEITAEVPGSTWTYWLGDGTVNKTSTYSTTTESLSHAFCFTPTDKTVNTEVEWKFKNAVSPQRIYETTLSLTNITGDQVLYLLPSTLGATVLYQLVDSSLDVLPGVTVLVQKVIGGSTVTIASDLTDTAGLANFFLSLQDAYTLTFSKTGFGSKSITITPISPEITTIQLGDALIGIVNGTDAGNNLTYSFLPSNYTLLNNTSYDFGIITEGSGISFVSFNLTNITGDQVLYLTDTTEGTLSGSFNTLNYTELFGRVIVTNNGENITLSTSWAVGNFFVGDYSIERQLGQLYHLYGFERWVQLIMALLALVAISIYLSNNEVLDSSESKVIVITSIVLMFSLLGWLDTGLVVNSSNQSIVDLTKFSSQYGIFIVTAIASSAYLLRRYTTR